MQLFAKIISYLLHPLLMPTFLFGVLLYFIPQSFQQFQSHGWLLLSVFFGMTFVLPGLNLLFFKLTGTIKTLNLMDRRERIMPSMLISLVYCVISYMIYWKIPFPVFYKLMFIVAALSVVVTIVTLFFKISVHAIGMSGLAGILLAMATLSSASELVVPSLFAIVLSGLVMSARLFLDAHDLPEVGWGGVVGFAIGFGGVVVLF
jgi:hypothetical protein